MLSAEQWERSLHIYVFPLGCSSSIISSTVQHSLYSSVAERQSCKLKVLGSIPSGGCLN